MMSTKNKQTPKKMGKPKEYGKANTSKIKSSDSSGRDGALSFPMLKTAENDRMLPRYFAILNRTEDDGVGMEDVDALQLELEALLSAVVVRNRVLREEIAALNNAEEKQQKGKPGISHVSPLSPGKRAKQQERPMKKLKEMSAKSRGNENSLSPLPPIRFTKVKSIPTTSTSRSLPSITLPDHGEPGHHEAPKVVLPKNDTANKFWQSVEPFCSDLVVDDIKLLDELIQEQENDAEYQKVPPLGQHYTLRWAQEELAGHSDSSSSKVKLRTSSDSADGSSTKRQDSGNTGPLTQRLLSCLMEENIMVQSQDSFDSKRCRGGENTKPTRSLTTANASSLERRLRKELEGQGLLDLSEQKDPADDEILRELRRCQAELKVISNHNVTHLKRLKKLAIEEMARQDLKKKLQAADNEVLDVYRKINAAKQKKKMPTKEEIENTWKVLKDREILLRQIDNM
ncbi:Transcriptional adapter 3-B [Blattella germanica]|nr:Transcriptional adapter 3-B [Blattella germanica]